MTANVFFKEYGLRIAAWAFLVLFVGPSSCLSVMWATQDKTLFWGRFDVASAQRVDRFDDALLQLASKIDTLISGQEELKRQNAILVNGRLTDIFDLNIRKDSRFTEDEKLDIQSAITNGQMTIDELRQLSRTGPER